MGWCSAHLEKGCVFGDDPELAGKYCPERSGGECTLVHIMLVAHNLAPEVRRRVIAALYPAYGIADDPANGAKAPVRRPRAES